MVIFCEQRGRGGSFQGGGVAVVGAEPLQPPWARAAEDRSRSRGHPLIPSKWHVFPASHAAGQHRRCHLQAGLCRRCCVAMVEAPWVSCVSLAMEEVLSASRPGPDPRAILHRRFPSSALVSRGCCQPPQKKAALRVKSVPPEKPGSGREGVSPSHSVHAHSGDWPPSLTGFPPHISRAMQV